MNTFILDLLSAAVLASLMQNMVFAGGLGLTEAIRMAAKPNNLIRSTGLVGLYSVSVTLLCRFVDMLPGVGEASVLIHGIIFVMVLSLVYLLVLGVGVLLKTSALTKRRMGVCALNTLVLSLPYIVYQSAFSLAQALGTAIGAAFAYLIAVVLMHLGFERIRENQSIPEAFKGNGAMFIYAALLSLAMAGITGTRIQM